MSEVVDAGLDLVLERVVDVAPEKVWAAWTQAKHLQRWFTPRPWRTGECVIDLRPGGLFRTEILGPDGERFLADCCYLEIVEGRRLVWTNVLGTGFRPASVAGGCTGHAFTAILTFTPEGSGTRYRAHVIHGTPEAKLAHEEKGFYDGWGSALDQLIELAEAGEL